VARAKYAGQNQIAQSLDQLDKTVAELDVARGGPRRAVVTDAFRQITDLIHAMSDALAAPRPAPTAGPTTRPSAAWRGDPTLYSPQWPGRVSATWTS
jgi:hypothetical protein